MSEPESAANSGYSTPVPELDDHRHHHAASSVSRTDRPRRGTFDSLYGRHLQAEDDNDARAEPVSPTPHIRYVEEAVVDDDGEISPSAVRPRGATAESCRSASPPNSVKAFAEARRGRELSFSDPRGERRAAGETEVHRAMSVASRRSYRSRQMTVAEEADDASIDANTTAEADVCFPQDEPRTGSMRVDFEYLENFMHADAAAREAQRAAPPAESKVFSDIRPGSAASGNGPAQRMVTIDGDFMGSPSDDSLPGAETEKPNTANAEGIESAEPGMKIPKEPRFNFFSTAWESTIHSNDLSGLVLPGETIRGLFSFPKGETDGVWWLNMTDPNPDEVNAICRAFGIHPLTTEDITQEEPREKIEIFPSYYFACCRYAKEGTDLATGEIEYQPYHMYVVVFREGTLSFSFNNHTHAIDVRKRISALKDYVSLSSDWICYALIDHIVDSFKPFIDKIEAQTEHIEDEVFLARDDDMQVFLRRIGTVRKNVMSLMRILGGKADVLKGFAKRCNENYSVTPRMDIGMYLGDIQDHVVTMMANLGHFEKMLSRSHSNYLAQIQIHNIAQGTHTNKVLSKITMLAGIIVPLNVVTGVFGMNVKVPWIERETDNLYPFIGIISFLVAFCAIAILIARRLRFI